MAMDNGYVEKKKHSEETVLLEQVFSKIPVALMYVKLEKNYIFKRNGHF